MGMQTDVLSTHLNSSGQCVDGRNRLKGIVLVGTATAGTLNLWDSTTAPTVATYARSGNTITVTSVAHGLQVGQQVGITFAVAGGSSATNGNYVIQTAATDTFVVYDINSGTIAGGTTCNYVLAENSNNSPWLTSMDTSAVTAGANVIYYTFPGEGLLAHTGIYATFSNMTGLTVFYG
jgi:WD40 repeat protein